MRRRGACNLSPVLFIDGGQTTIDYQAMLFPGQLERQATRMGFLAQIEWRRPSRIHEEGSLSRIDALVAGVRSIRYRRTARIVIGEYRGEQVDRRRPHTVELREVSVAVPEKAQHRHDAIDRIVERLRRLQLACGEQLSQRQQVSQQLDERPRIATDMSAVG